MSLVILAAGNPSRGDDALGPLLLARIAALQPEHTNAHPGILDLLGGRCWGAPQGFPGAGEITLIEDFQFQVEHALDLADRDLALFIDAGTGTAGPFSFHEIAPAAELSVSTHALSPQAVLQVYCDVQQASPPPAFVLCVRGEAFELGEGLSHAARANLEAAWTHLLRCLEAPRASAWRTLQQPLS